ncbi:hypothetical protein QN277_028984 [Acacia crassicarpa]|uniref:Uncharacterized protein n=1 Tax=Acacia crassicarpa TaxID=499986 RepID=A0AAE1J7S7_9FABA|nr:hypothetical protein QN277_028984 [Acacia crassicarpa]
MDGLVATILTPSHSLVSLQRSPRRRRVISLQFQPLTSHHSPSPSSSAPALSVSPLSIASVSLLLPQSQLAVSPVALSPGVERSSPLILLPHSLSHHSPLHLHSPVSRHNRTFFVGEKERGCCCSHNQRKRRRRWRDLTAITR